MSLLEKVIWEHCHALLPIVQSSGRRISPGIEYAHHLWYTCRVLTTREHATNCCGVLMANHTIYGEGWGELLAPAPWQGQIVWFGNSTFCCPLVCTQHMKSPSCVRWKKCDGFLQAVDMETTEIMNICSTQITKDIWKTEEHYIREWLQEEPLDIPTKMVLL